jgi:hypothetical protein
MINFALSNAYYIGDGENPAASYMNQLDPVDSDHECIESCRSSIVELIERPFLTLGVRMPFVVHAICELV